MQFNAKPVNPLINDDLTDAIEITGNFVDSLAQTTEGATSQDNEATASCASNEASVWYQLTASIDQAVVFDTFGSNYNTVLSVWTGEQYPLTEIACNDDEGNRDTQQSQISMALSEGTTYYLRITGGTDSEGGLLVLNTTFFSSNDDVARAIPIESLPYSHSQNTAHTTLEFDELISKCGLQDSTSVWYQYTPSDNQQVSFSTEGSDYDTILSLWTGEAHPLTGLDCNDDAITGKEGEQTSQISLPLIAENTYFIKVSSPAEKTGNLVLQVESTINDISIIEQPVEQTILSGERATLTVKTGGTEPFSYQWYEGKSGDVSIPRINAKIFTTPPLTETVHYWVRVTNSTGTIDSQTVTITVGEQITNGIAINTEDHEIATTANFEGLITLKGENAPVDTVSQTDDISVTFKITPDANHIGQSADIIIVGIYTIDTSYFYMREGGSAWNLWDGNFTNLEVAETKELTESVDVTIYESSLNGLSGLFTVYVGYRLDNGSIFYTSEPMNFTVE